MRNTVELTSVVFKGVHPVLDNPHNRNAAEVEALVLEAGGIIAAAGIKLMLVQTMLNRPITTNNTGADNE